MSAFQSSSTPIPVTMRTSFSTMTRPGEDERLCALGCSVCVGDLPVSGVVFNTWNGYTEGYAAVPTLENGDADFRWMQELFS